MILLPTIGGFSHNSENCCGGGAGGGGRGRGGANSQSVVDHRRLWQERKSQFSDFRGVTAT